MSSQDIGSRPDLIYDWNARGGDRSEHGGHIEFDDESLRDGLQSPSVVDPPIATKIEILRLMDRLCIQTADIGLPGAGPRAARDVEALAREIVQSKLKIRPNCAARTMIRDIEPIVEISDRVGIPIEACTFIGSSPIRQYVEDWPLDKLIRLTTEAVSYATKHGVRVMYVTEDTTRAHPDTLAELFKAAIGAGAERLCLCDTVGHATPEGVEALVHFARKVIAGEGAQVRLDWHGHNDRGLGVINSIAAVGAGVDRVHGTALGIGERVGNAPLDQMLVNFRLLGWIDNDLSALGEYCRLVSQASGVPIPVNYPVVGSDAFRTGTGVHAAAVIKALRKGDVWLADMVYSGVPAHLFGGEQRIEIGPMSGESNVIFWLEQHGITPAPDLVKRIFARAKESDRVLGDDELKSMVTSGDGGTRG
jgi:2-isopropylmalate synthase